MSSERLERSTVTRPDNTTMAVTVFSEQRTQLRRPWLKDEFGRASKIARDNASTNSTWIKLRFVKITVHQITDAMYLVNFIL